MFICRLQVYLVVFIYVLYIFWKWATYSRIIKPIHHQTPLQAILQPFPSLYLRHFFLIFNLVFSLILVYYYLVSFWYLSFLFVFFFQNESTRIFTTLTPQRTKHHPAPPNNARNNTNNATNNAKNQPNNQFNALKITLLHIYFINYLSFCPIN